MGSNLSIPETAYSMPASYEAIFSSLEAIKALVEANPDLIRKQDQYGRLLFHIACGNRNASHEVIRFLYEAYPEAIYVGDRDGNTPLDYACIASHSLDMIKTLLEYYPGAVSIKDKYGKLALHHACGFSSEKVIEILKLKYLEAVNVEDKSSQLSKIFAEDRIAEIATPEPRPLPHKTMSGLEIL